MSGRRSFHMTAAAWRQIRTHWRLPLTRQVLWQSYVAGPWHSMLNSYQSALSARDRDTTCLSGSIVVLGYWRSGTTLLHNYLAHDSRFGFPSTYACMHPQHFIFTQSTAFKRPQSAVTRPMDDVKIRASSPQEDEFGLMALGARSPYEALLSPRHLAEALRLADPRDLCKEQELHWQQTFKAFLQGVSLVEGHRPLILKSPPHGYRVATLRRMIPDARFVLIVRSPEIVFESTIRMWHSLFDLYAVGPIPPQDETRRAVLADRPYFETKLAEGLRGLAPENFVIVKYESLIRDPLNVIGQLYEQLRLGGFQEVERHIRAELVSGQSYAARNARPAAHWMQQVQQQWRLIFDHYGYPDSPIPR